MLDLQKASAGSGKTYTLARKFLEYMLVTGNPPRLRCGKELEDALRHILAITFTNKATAEMKDRIVTRLADLANPTLDPAKTTYMADFEKFTGQSADEIRAAAKDALFILLNNYSDFQVSTIDAFFQTILRTFAYEIGMNDSYDLELDSDFISRAAVDATLTDINSANPDKAVAEWVKAMMNRSASDSTKGWNIFAKSASGGLYKDIVTAVSKMASEQFKKVRQELEQFYAEHPDSLNDFKRVDNAVMKGLRDAVRDAKAAARAVQKALKNQENTITYIPGRIDKVLAAKGVKFPSNLTIPKKSGNEAAFNAAARRKGLTTSQQDFVALHDKFIDALTDWKAELEEKKLKLWQLYRANMRMLPLMYAAARKSADMLAEQNVIDMAETNSILHRVIGDDDAPFIYERLGSRLDHFLIDEFQDTSSMQWDNLRPLVTESMSRGNGNLIIGDAKQSIYRFRNADPSLISQKVPLHFPGQVNERGESKAENTNHRSLRTIVEFNNSAFHALATHLDDAMSDNKTFFADLYANVAQYPANQNREGYVEIRCYEKGKMETDVNNGDDSDIPPKHFADVAALIADLHSRGYNYADIAVLVRTNQEGRQMINTLVEHNKNNPDKPIEFVSEESLLIAGAESVKAIISVMRLIADGSIDEEKAAREERAKATNSWYCKTLSLSLFNCRYDQLALEHPEMSTSEIMQLIGNDNADCSNLESLIRSVDSLALPALVETVALRAVPQQRRIDEAPYIAAFQDLVLDYCQRYPSDILSFLQWWDAKGCEKSISSPEGVDAISIMTVHKAKGLEYQCVIIPKFDWKQTVSDQKTEWRWVKTAPEGLELPEELAALIPPMLPVETRAAMADTVHREEYQDYMREVRMDMINTTYVAFTRAVAELYIFIPEEASAQDRTEYAANALLVKLRELAHDDATDCAYPLPHDMIPKDECSTDKPLCIGEPLTSEAIARLGSKLRQSDGDAISEYYVRDPSGFLHFRDPESLHADSADPDPRSLGNRLHDIMSDVVTAADLDTAIRRRVINGTLTAGEGEEARRILAEKLSRPEVAEWFAPGLEVLTERTILTGPGRMERPDRIVVDAGGNATVIDYKFGTERNDRRYARQVAEYITQLRRTGHYATVAGRVWYVLLDHLLPLP